MIFMYTHYTIEHSHDITTECRVETPSCRPDHPDDQNAHHTPPHSDHHPEEHTPRNPERRFPKGRKQSTAPIIYICSRLRGKDQAEVEQNMRRAQMFSRFVASQGKVPIMPHQLYPKLILGTDYEKLGERVICDLLHSDELWAFVPDGIFSRGMVGAMKTANDLKSRFAFSTGI